LQSKSVNPDFSQKSTKSPLYYQPWQATAPACPGFAITKFVRIIVCTPSAEQLRPKGGKTMVGRAVAEHSNNLQKGRP